MSSENLQTKCLKTSQKTCAVRTRTTAVSKLKSTKERNPLATLCENNQQLPQNEAQNSRKKRTSSTILKATSTSSVSVKSRSKCTSGLPNNVNTALITVRAASSSKESDDEDEVFVPGETHYINYVSQEQRVEYVQKIEESKESKMVQTLPVVRVSGDFLKKKAEADEAKPAVKTTLARKLGRRFSRFRLNTEDFYTNSLYDDEYVEDNYKYMLRTEGQCVYRKSFLRKYIVFGNRLVLVNWLVYVHQVLEYSESTLFTTIRMFDSVLIKSVISTKEYVLIAITCMWIVSKVHESSVVSVHKLFTLCNGKFSKCQFIWMEREILKILNFQTVFPEPSAFLYYYLKKTNLEGNTRVLFGAMFILEVSTMLLDFSATGPSVLAASALYLVLQKYDMDYTSFADLIDSHLLQTNVFKKFCEQIANCLQNVLECKAIKSNEVVAKYSVQEKMNVAHYFIQ